MMKKIKILLLTALSFTNFFAQESVATTGGNATGTGGSLSYTYGQIVYTSFGSAGTVGQGVQQPYEISEVAGNEKIKGINLSITTFPNPTSDFITIKIADLEFKNLNFQLNDMTGKLLDSGTISSNETMITLKKYPAATYHLLILKNNEQLKTYKIIKNQ
jgi:hypothetical protein